MPQDVVAGDALDSYDTDRRSRRHRRHRKHCSKRNKAQKDLTQRTAKRRSTHSFSQDSDAQLPPLEKIPKDASFVLHNSRSYPAAQSLHASAVHSVHSPMEPLSPCSPAAQLEQGLQPALTLGHLDCAVAPKLQPVLDPRSPRSPKALAFRANQADTGLDKVSSRLQWTLQQACGVPVVTQVDPNGPGHAAGLRKGDEIQAVNGQQVSNVEQVRDLEKAAETVRVLRCTQTVLCRIPKARPLMAFPPNKPRRGSEDSGAKRPVPPAKPNPPLNAPQRLARDGPILRRYRASSIPEPGVHWQTSGTHEPPAAAYREEEPLTEVRARTDFPHDLSVTISPRTVPMSLQGTVSAIPSDLSHWQSGRGSAKGSSAQDCSLSSLDNTLQTLAALSPNSVEDAGRALATLSPPILPTQRPHLLNALRDSLEFTGKGSDGYPISASLTSSFPASSPSTPPKLAVASFVPRFLDPTKCITSGDRWEKEPTSDRMQFVECGPYVRAERSARHEDEGDGYRAKVAKEMEDWHATQPQKRPAQSDDYLTLGEVRNPELRRLSSAVEPQSPHSIKPQLGTPDIGDDSSDVGDGDPSLVPYDMEREEDEPPLAKVVQEETDQKTPTKKEPVQERVEVMRVQHEARRKSSVYSVKSHHSAPGEDFPPELEEATPKRLVLKLQKQQRTWGRKKAGKAGGDGEGEERFLRFAADCDIQTGEEVLRLEYGDPFPKVQLLFVNTEGEVDKGFDGVVTVQLSDGTRLHGTTTAQMKEGKAVFDYVTAGQYTTTEERRLVYRAAPPYMGVATKSWEVRSQPISCPERFTHIEWTPETRRQMPEEWVLQSGQPLSAVVPVLKLQVTDSEGNVATNSHGLAVVVHFSDPNVQANGFCVPFVDGVADCQSLVPLGASLSCTPWFSVEHLPHSTSDPLQQEDIFQPPSVLQKRVALPGKGSVYSPIHALVPQRDGPLSPEGKVHGVAGVPVGNVALSIEDSLGQLAEALSSGAWSVVATNSHGIPMGIGRDPGEPRVGEADEGAGQTDDVGEGCALGEGGASLSADGASGASATQIEVPVKNGQAVFPGLVFLQPCRDCVITFSLKRRPSSARSGQGQSDSATFASQSSRQCGAGDTGPQQQLAFAAEASIEEGVEVPEAPGTLSQEPEGNAGKPSRSKSSPVKTTSSQPKGMSGRGGGAGGGPLASNEPPAGPVVLQVGPITMEGADSEEGQRILATIRAVDADGTVEEGSDEGGTGGGEATPKSCGSRETVAIAQGSAIAGAADGMTETRAPPPHDGTGPGSEAAALGTAQRPSVAAAAAAAMLAALVEVGEWTTAKSVAQDVWGADWVSHPVDEVLHEWQQEDAEDFDTVTSPLSVDKSPLLPLEVLLEAAADEGPRERQHSKGPPDGVGADQPPAADPVGAADSAGPAPPQPADPATPGTSRPFTRGRWQRSLQLIRESGDPRIKLFRFRTKIRMLQALHRIAVLSDKKEELHKLQSNLQEMINATPIFNGEVGPDTAALLMEVSQKFAQLAELAKEGKQDFEVVAAYKIVRKDEVANSPRVEMLSAASSMSLSNMDASVTEVLTTSKDTRVFQDLASDFTDLATCIKDDPQADVEPLSAYEIQAKPESDGRRRSGSVITKRDFRQYPPLSPPSGPLLPQRPRPQAAATSLRKAKGPEEVVRDDTAFALENFEMPHDEEACSELSSRPSSVGVPGGQGAA
mmetsp:Transcript_10695/g.16426  ORF Transcript_10695/g.16426 Transcript_10695/m.16426 type:complete len:1700 (+) Transcript_10695:197-5296(+)|eukprot:CAMPEP_0174310082 /NCGR_PEP_ID=MMETSP0810-20121108/2823_1 /TAXON_ID=73025 ORGANISM="Eutreptiella gymnastica-like, Strain CCMP1594" /NCGR_SAMPLE_ID=MMETSP0810 /ASSEMBLY_ACC=CAM_ASM_000659 /LENGTH=1699 /DNA_ID=CAMNT_0015417897 /DNA_START=196 /DNA_END=5295 /DNA_ORIENTATION=-